MWFVIEVSDAQTEMLRARGFAGVVRQEVGFLGLPIQIAVEGVLRFVDRPRSQSVTFTDLPAMIARLGRDGWEMVGHDRNDDITDLYFKRKIAWWDRFLP